MQLPEPIRDRLPSDGVMGTLRRRRPTLYWLVLAVGVVAYLAILMAGVYGLLLLPLVAARTMATAAVGGPVETGLWLVVTGGVAAINVTVVYLAMRWISAFDTGGDE